MLRRDELIFLAVPTSRWFEVSAIEVATPVTTASPRVRVDRTIHRPFTAVWTATIRQESGVGYAQFCSRNGRNDYLPDAVLPPETDLNWWLAIPPNAPCPALPPGRYVLSIVWQIETEGPPIRVLRAESNVFVVG